MATQIDAGGRMVPFRLDFEHGRWHALDEELEEEDFPLITVVDGKRYELYSDGDLAEVEK